MKHLLLLTLSSFLYLHLFAQTASIKGQLQDPDGASVAFANVALYSTTDSSLVKVETSDESGVFRLRDLAAGNYSLLVAAIFSQIQIGNWFNAPVTVRGRGAGNPVGITINGGSLDLRRATFGGGSSSGGFFGSGGSVGFAGAAGFVAVAAAGASPRAALTISVTDGFSPSGIAAAAAFFLSFGFGFPFGKAVLTSPVSRADRISAFEPAL